MTWSISSEKIGVGVSGLPTITRASWIGRPSSTSRELELRHVDEDVAPAHVGRQPAPALHVGEDVALEPRAAALRLAAAEPPRASP